MDKNRHGRFYLLIFELFLVKMLQLTVCITPFSVRSCYLRIVEKKKCALVIIEQQSYYLEFCFFLNLKPFP